MLVGNCVLGAGESRFTAGIAFGKQTLLRFGIVLYGLRLTFQDIAHVGVAGPRDRHHHAELHFPARLVGGDAVASISTGPPPC